MILAFEALVLSKKIGYKKGEAISLSRMGNAYRVLGNYPKALNVYLASLKISESIGDTEGIERNLTSIGVIYDLNGNHRQGLDYSFKALALAQQMQNQKRVCIVIACIAADYYHLKMYDSASIYCQQAYELASRLNYPRQVGDALEVLGDIHSETGQSALALEYYRLSIPPLQRAPNYISMCDAYLGMSKLFYNAGHIDSALYYAWAALAIAKSKGFGFNTSKISNFLFTVYNNKQHADSALYYLQLTKAANDSLFNNQNQMQLQSMLFDEKVRQLQKAEQEERERTDRAHNLQYVAIAICLITFIILFFLLSHSVVVTARFIQFFGVLGLLALFEFINLLIHPYLERLTDHSPTL